MDGEGSSDGQSAERRVEFRVRRNGRKDKVIVERCAAEGLPEGWIKELVITKKARKLRKDPFFVDPKSGYIFHSLKDASRYVSTGVIGNLARKPKENNHNEDDSGNGKTLSPSGSTEKRSPENLLEKEKKLNIYVRNTQRKSISSLVEYSETCKRSSNPSTTSSHVLLEEARENEQRQDHMKRELISCSENDATTSNEQHVEKRITRSQARVTKNDDYHELGRKSSSSLNAKSEDCLASSKLESVSSQTLEGSGKKEKAQDSSERKPISCSENDMSTTPLKQAVERRVTRSQVKVMNDDNSELKKIEFSDSLPRRASKRLAGIELEPTPELKARTRARQVPTAEQADDARTAKCKEPVLGGKPVLGSCNMTVMPLSQVVTKKNEEHSSPKKIAASSYCKNTETPLVIEKNNQAVDKRSEGRSGKKPNVALGSNKKMEWRVSTRAPQTANAKSDKAANGKCEGASKESIAFPDIYKQARETPPVPMLSFEAAATKFGGTTCRRSGRFSQSKPNTLPNSQKRNEIPVIWNKGGHPSVLDNNIASGVPAGNFAVIKGACSALTEKNANSVSEPLAFDSTLVDLWKDPCIAFAIKTLTGESLDPPNTADILTEPKKSNAVNNHDEQRGVTSFPVMPESSNTSYQRPGYSTELPDIWTDPCIDFAIKTLTGAIPIGFDEPEDQSNSQLMKSMASTQSPEGRQSDRDHLDQQCNSRHKAVSGGACFPQQVGTSANLRFSPSFSKG